MNEEQCPICLTTFENKNIFITKCGHTFCGDCIMTNIQINNKCPLCRQDIVERVTDEHLTEYENRVLSRDLHSRYADIIIDSIRDILRIYQELI